MCVGRGRSTENLPEIKNEVVPRTQFALVPRKGIGLSLLIDTAMATVEDFEKLDIRVGKIVAVEEFPEAEKPAYKLSIDFGPEVGVKHSSARVSGLYTRAQLQGRLVICVTNLPPRQIGPFSSEVLTTGFYRSDGAVVLAVPEQDAPLGARLG